jgi:hypothetical protein
LNQSSDISISLFDSNDLTSKKLEEHTEIEGKIRQFELVSGETLEITTSSNEVNKRSIVKIRFKALQDLNRGIDLGFLFNKQEYIQYDKSENSLIVSPDLNKPNFNFKENKLNER